MKSPMIRTIELWRDAGKFDAAARFAAVSFPGRKNEATRFDLIDGIVNAAMKAGDYASAEDIRDRHPEDVSIETNWELDDFLEAVEIVGYANVIPITPAYGRG